MSSAQFSRLISRVDLEVASSKTTTWADKYPKVCVALACLLFFILGFATGYVCQFAVMRNQSMGVVDTYLLNDTTSLFTIVDTFPTDIWTKYVHKRINVGNNNSTFCGQYCLQLHNGTQFPSCHFYHHYGHVCYFGDFRIQTENQYKFKELELPPSDLDIFYLENSYDFKADVEAQHPNLNTDHCPDQGYLEVNSLFWNHSLIINYQGNMDCWWFIDNVHGFSGHFELTFEQFVSEDGFDTLTLQLGPYKDSPKYNETLTGSKDSVEIQWDSPWMAIHWHTDAHAHKQNMKGEIKFVKT